MKTIMLIDMDYFFVACEELRHPEIKGVPAVVGFDPKEGRGRGVVMTCNYEARAFGLRSGMPISQAYKLKPDAKYLGFDHEYYEDVSKRIMEVLRVFADSFEQVSIDEAFLDVSKRTVIIDPEEYAMEIKQAVLDKVGLKCSIGIGPNKLIAKMVCDEAKPNGIKTVKEDRVKEFLKDKKIGELYGVGPKTSERLEKMGYNTIEKLAKANVVKIVGEFGTFGGDLVKYANGIDDSEVTDATELKSISREITLDQDTGEDEKVIKAIAELSNLVSAELSKVQEHFKTVTLKLRYNDFTEHIHSRSIKITNDPEALVAAAVDLYKENVDRNRKVRKLGVRVSNLISYKGQKKIV